MTEFTPARLAELKAVAEAATHGEWGGKAVWNSDYQRVQLESGVVWDGAKQTADGEWIDSPDIRHIATFDPPTVLALIAALETKTGAGDEADTLAGILIEVERERNEARGLYWDASEAEDALHNINNALIARVEKAERERDEARATAEDHVLDADETYVRMAEKLEQVKRERDEARAEATQWEAEIREMLGVDIPALKEERDDARAALKAKDSYVGDLEEQLQHIKSLWRATGRAETDAHRRAVRAEAAIERVRAAATEVTNQGDNHGRTHYEKCWTQHLHCLAAKIIHETGADDE